jgi:hypothetical protein
MTITEQEQVRARHWIQEDGYDETGEVDGDGVNAVHEDSGEGRNFFAREPYYEVCDGID